MTMDAGYHLTRMIAKLSNQETIGVEKVLVTNKKTYHNNY